MPNRDLALFAKPDNIEEIEISLNTDESSIDEKSEVKQKQKFNPLYAYFVLFLVLICRIVVMWHRAGLSYAYGYSGVGTALGDPVYEISKFYP